MRVSIDTIALYVFLKDKEKNPAIPQNLMIQHFAFICPKAFCLVWHLAGVNSGSITGLQGVQLLEDGKCQR